VRAYRSDRCSKPKFVHCKKAAVIATKARSGGLEQWTESATKAGAFFLKVLP